MNTLPMTSWFVATRQAAPSDIGDFVEARSLSIDNGCLVFRDGLTIARAYAAGQWLTVEVNRTSDDT